jgi:hypothetical protein
VNSSIIKSCIAGLAVPAGKSRIGSFENRLRVAAIRIPGGAFPVEPICYTGTIVAFAIYEYQKGFLNKV